MISKDGHSQGQDSLDALLDAAVDAIILVDRRGIVLRFNPAAQRLFGLTERDILGKNVSELMPEPDHSRHDRYIKRYLDGGQPAIIGAGREITGLHASGATLPLHLSVGEIKGGGEARFVGIIRDLSAEKETESVVRELERHLAHADRLVVLGEITAGIAHEINQPLTAIAAFADAGARLLNQDAPEAKEELETVCRRISEQARRAGDVVSRLRGMSRRSEASKSTEDLGALLNTVLHLFEHELTQNG
ncbi:MAG: PAS domain S-box protein, partial [Xanthomonadales bacterium]|nr:PAS domain S-box protein [Xanthomonadales bacterium]